MMGFIILALDFSRLNIWYLIYVTASPPRFVSAEELMETAKGVTNMALAHEIVVNGDFRIKPTELPEGR